MIHPAVLADMIRQSQERDRQREAARRASEQTASPRLPEPRRAVEPVEPAVEVPLAAGSR